MRFYNEWKAKAIYSPVNDDMEIYLSRHSPEGVHLLSSDMEIRLHEPGTRAEPTFRLPRDVVRSLFDSLWEEGYRPKDKRYEAEADLLKGQLSLQANHLEDMRALVFKAPTPQGE